MKGILKKTAAAFMAAAMVSGAAVPAGFVPFADTAITAEAVEQYHFKVADTWVTSENAADILGNGVFSYFPDTHTLEVHGNYTFDRTDTALIDNYSADIFINATSPSVLTAERVINTWDDVIIRTDCRLELNGLILEQCNYIYDLSHPNVDGSYFGWYDCYLSYPVCGEFVYYGRIEEYDNDCYCIWDPAANSPATKMVFETLSDYPMQDVKIGTEWYNGDIFKTDAYFWRAGSGNIYDDDGFDPPADLDLYIAGDYYYRYEWHITHYCDINFSDWLFLDENDKPDESIEGKIRGIRVVSGSGTYEDPFEIEPILAEETETKVAFTNNSMSLGGAISLNFYADLSGVPADKLNKSYVEFEVNGKKQKANFNPNKTNKAGNYGFNCALNSISMADDVKATLHYYDVNGDEKSLTHTASCETYLKKFNESDEEPLWNLIKGINDYGYYMQQYLSSHSANNWTLDVDHKAMEKSFKMVARYLINKTAYISELEDMKVQKVWETNPDIEKVNYSLVLDSNTAINFKFTKKDGYNGKFEVKLDGKKVTPKSIGNNRYQVTASGISAHLLDKPHTITVKTDHGTSTYTDPCSPMFMIVSLIP